MKIAYLVNQYPAISHTFIRREIRALEALGTQVVRVTIRQSKEGVRDPIDQIEVARTRVILHEGMRGLGAAMVRASIERPYELARAARLAAELGTGSDRGLAVHGAYLAEACVLREWLEAEQVEHVHAHFGTNSATVALLCHALGGPPFSFTVHGPEEFDKPEAIRLATKIQHARFVVAVSSFGRSQCWRLVRSGDWSKLHVVRCGVDGALLERAITPVPDVPRVCAVGRLSAQKGPLLLIDAVARLRESGVPIELVMVGDGEMRAAVETAIALRGLCGSVRITGWADGAMVIRELEAARAMVLPSEGLPVVIMEALALGRPVISTYVAGIPELVIPGRSGWLVPAGNVEALVDALRECLATSTGELSAMGARGRADVAAMHDAARSARKLNALFAGETPAEVSLPARRRVDAHRGVRSARGLQMSLRIRDGVGPV